MEIQNNPGSSNMDQENSQFQEKMEKRIEKRKEERREGTKRAYESRKQVIETKHEAEVLEINTQFEVIIVFVVIILTF